MTHNVKAIPLKEVRFKLYNFAGETNCNFGVNTETGVPKGYSEYPMTPKPQILGWNNYFICSATELLKFESR